MSANAIEVFFSYSHKDEALRDKLAEHLAGLKRGGVIRSWCDRQIEAGSEWASEIDSRLNTADIILLLISASFINSDYCWGIELEQAMKRHHAGKACVIPVILRPVDWSDAPFSKLQAFPKDAKAVTSWDNQDEAFVDVTQGIRRVAKQLYQLRQQQRQQQEAARAQYLKKVEEFLADGQISEIERDTLDELREELDLTPTEANEIEERAFEPHKRYARNLERYQQTLQKIIHQYPFSDEIQADLKLRQQDLGLKPEDVERIERPILAQAEALYQESLRQRAYRSSPELFTDHRRVVTTLINDLKRLREYSKELGLERSIQLIDNVLERIENNAFSIAVVGKLKRGKSTFINALLGRKALPVDILPCSATPVRVTYGAAPQVKIIFKDGREEEVAINQWTDYVTQLTPESEATAATVKEAIVYCPTPYCQNNVDIIDTPGWTDDVAMMEITLSVLSQVDAAIMVIMAQAPFSEAERDFLETKLLTTDLGRIIFVMTEMDRVTNPDDAQKVIRHIRDRISRSIMQRAKEQYGENSPEFESYRKRIGTVKVYGVSAHEALQAKMTGDGELLVKSQFPQFEEDLKKFLTQERGAVSLQVLVNRIITSATEILKTINLQENALLIKQEEFQQAYERLLAEIESFRERKAEKTKLEVSAMLDNIQNTLADLRSKREQNELLSEHQQQRLTQIGNEVQRILKNVHHLSHERRST